MKISVSKIMTFSSTFRITNRLQDFCNTYNLKRHNVEAYFALYLANLIKQRIQNSVKFQKVNGIPMRRIYEPLSEAYNKRKPRNTKNKFYRNTDWLIKNIKVYRYNGQYYIGFTTHKKHPSGAKAQDILAWNEAGTKYIPARPLIRPHLKWIMKRLDIYWNTFEKLFKDNMK